METIFETKLTRKTLIIPGRLDNLNDYTKQCRANKYAGAECKRQNENCITAAILEQFKGVQFTGRVYMHFRWIEPNRNRDPDNICFAKKFILDSLVSNGIIETDGWRGVAGFTDEFEVEPFNPRIEVIIEGRLKGVNE